MPLTQLDELAVLIIVDQQKQNGGVLARCPEMRPTIPQPTTSAIAWPSIAHASRAGRFTGSRTAIVCHIAADREALAETYLRNRGITVLRGIASLRFHPRCSQAKPIA